MTTLTKLSAKGLSRTEEETQWRLPEWAVIRLALYLRSLCLLPGQVEVISSQELGEALQLSPEQIRKDLSYFGKFGRRSQGYNVERLILELRRILGLEHEWRMAVVGVGRIGRALLGYSRFSTSGLRVVAAFDIDPSIVGKIAEAILVLPVSKLTATVKRKGVAIGIVSVPAVAAQQVVDGLIEGGVKAIVNYAPVAVRVPPGVRLRDIDPIVAIQSMTFYLSQER